MNNKLYFLAILITLKSYSCTGKDGFSKEKETQAIVALLQQERKAHFARNAELFMSGFADSMLSVNRGKVSVASPDETGSESTPILEVFSSSSGMM